jgi:hypothetical protein
MAFSEPITDTQIPRAILERVLETAMVWFPFPLGDG